MQEQTIALSATFTAEPLKDSLSFWMDELHLPTEIEFAPYNQVFQQLLDPSSLLLNNLNGFNIVLLRLEDWQRFKGKSAASPFGEDDQRKIEKNIQDLAHSLKAAASSMVTPFLLCICPNSPNVLADLHLAAFYTKMEELLVSELGATNNLHIIRCADMKGFYPVTDYYDSHSDKLGHIPFTQRFFTALGTMIARKIFAIKSSPRKVIVLDCDQTLWKGVCGEDGVWGIEIDSDRKILQEFVVEQHNAGMLICLCSKNNEIDVRNVFQQRAEMPLKWEHIVSWRINWNAKSGNIESLAEELKLGLDSFIFIDDDPVVCAEVEANCPDVLTLRLPVESAKIPQFLNHVWAFDHLIITAEDKKRASTYKQNAGRELLRKQANNFEDFLASLELKVTISEMGAEHLARVSQLTQRTNQFNFTTIRRSESDIQILCDSSKVHCLVVHVTDRFGDYGLVGGMIFHTDEAAITVDTFLLSCRVLGRGVEHRMLAKLGEIALQQGRQYVDVTCIVSAKNQPALDFLNKVGERFKHSIAEGLLYRFPADQAALVSSCDLLEAAVSSDLPKKQAAPINASGISGTVTQSKAKTLSRIPNELCEVELILSNIQMRKQRLTSRHSEDVVAARDELEERLIRVWEEVLSIRPIAISDNFFELGGDSLAAVHLFSLIGEEFGKDFSLATLFQAPTIELLANLLRKENTATDLTSLISIQPQGDKIPFFCVHAGGGNVLFYKDLAKHLGTNQPFYGLQAQGIDGKHPRHRSVEEMATHYIKEMRSVQPEGPYFFGGACFGGLVSFEMAQQLHAAGEEVGLVAMFDTYGPGYPVLLPSTKLLHLEKFFKLVRRVEHHLRSLYKLPGKHRSQYIAAKTAKAKMIFRRSINKRKQEITYKYRELFAAAVPQSLEKTQGTILQAQAAYQPKVYAGRIIQFRASRQPLGIRYDLTMGWDELAAEGIEVLEIEGIHGAIVVEPYAKALAQHLQARLQGTQTDRREQSVVKAYAVGQPTS